MISLIKSLFQSTQALYSMFTAFGAMLIVWFVRKDAKNEVRNEVLKENIKNVDFSDGGAIFIGNEGNGLPKETVEKCGRKVTIKMSGNTDSLNAAMATGIMMWELMKYE